MDKILENISILDMTEFISGPYATAILGDMGAKVIKVERPEGQWGRESEEPFNPFIVVFERNKKNLCLDLRKEAAKMVITRLVGRSDVIISNYGKGAMERMGFSYEACKRINPGIIYCTISGFGQKGTYSDSPASDTSTQAISGIMDSIGELEGPPLRVSFTLVDLFAGSFAVQGILAALYARQHGKLGMRIDISLINAAIALQTFPFTTYLITGKPPRRCGNQNPSLSPAGGFKTKDNKYLTIVVLRESHWEEFCEAIGRRELTNEQNFNSNSRRVENRGALNEILVPMFLSKSRDEWINIFKGTGVPCVPINTFDDISADPALFESLSLMEFNIMGRTIRSVGNPIEIDGKYLSMQSRASLKGEHTVEILEKLGYSHDEIQAMLSGGVAFSNDIHLGLSGNKGGSN